MIKVVASLAEVDAVCAFEEGESGCVFQLLGCYFLQLLVWISG